jgi:hypothetical protein
MTRAIAVVFAAIAVLVLGSGYARAQSTPPDSAWVQWEADGLPHVRAIVHAARCFRPVRSRRPSAT